MSQEEPSQPKSSLLRTIARRTLKVLAVIAILLLALVGFSQTSIFKDILREQVVQVTNGSLVGSVQIEDLEGNLFTGITAHNIKVFDRSGMLAASIDSATAHYDLWSLVDNSLVITDLHLERPVGIMRYDQNGDLNLLQIAAESNTPEDPNAAPFGIDVNHISLKGGALLYANQPEFVDTENARTIKARNELLTLLGAPEKLTTKDFYAKSLRPILRDTQALSTGDVPVLAALADISLEASFKLDKQEVITVTLSDLSSTLDANSWAKQQELTLKSTDVTYASDAVNVALDQLKILSTTNDTTHESGTPKLTLDLTLIPTEKDSETQTPYPEKLAASIKDLTLTRSLLNQTLPTLPVRDGFVVNTSVSGTLQDLALELQTHAMEQGAQVSMKGELKDVIPTFLTDMEFPPAAPTASNTTPTYDVSVDLKDINPAALYADLPTASITTTLKLNGEGLDPEKDLKANAEVTVEPSSIYEWQVRSGKLAAIYADKTLKITEGNLKTPYADATVEGSATWPGEVDFKISALTNESHQRALDLPQEQGVLRQKKVNLNATIKAKTDINSDDPVKALTRAAINADWDIKGLEQKDFFSLKNSTGTLKASLNTPANAANSRNVSVQLDMLAEDLSSKPADISVGYVKAKGSTQFRTPWLPDDPMQLRHKILADMDIDIRNFRGQGIYLGQLDASLATSPSSSALSYTLDVRRLSNLSYPAMKLKVGGLNTDLTGQVALSSTGEPTFLSAKGDGVVQNLSYDKEDIRRATFEVDVAGAPPLPRGEVTLNGDDLVVGGQALKEANVTASIQDNGNFSVNGEVTTDPDKQAELDQTQAGKDSEEDPSENADTPQIPAITTGKKPKKLRINASGNISDELDEVKDLNADIYNLNLDKDKPVWSIEDATVSTQGGTIKVDNLTLKNDDQRISIQGTYRERGAQDLKVEAKNVNVGEMIKELAIDDIVPDVKGKIEEIDLSLQGTADNPEITIDVVLKDFYYQDIGPIDLVLKGRYKNSKLTVNTLDVDMFKQDIIRGQARIPMKLDLQGNTTFFWTENILLTFFVDPIDLGKLSKNLKNFDNYTLAGTLMGGGILNGTLRKPTLDANINAQEVSFEGNLSGQRVNINNLSFASRFQYEPPSGSKGGFIVDASLSRQDRDIFTLKSNSPLPLADWIYETIEKQRDVDFAREVASQTFAIKASFNELQLHELSEMGLTQNLELKGLFDLKLDANGTFSEPSMEFKSTLNDFAVQGSMSGQKFDLSNINHTASITLDGSLGSLDPMNFSTEVVWDDRKVFDLSGQMKLPLNSWLTKLSRGTELDYFKESQTVPFNLTAKLDKFDLSKVAIAPVLTKSDAAGVISMDLSLDGTLRDPKGELDFNVGELECKSDPTQTKPCFGFGWDRYRDIVMAASLSIEDELMTLKDLKVNWDDKDIATATGSLPLPMDTLLDGAPLNDLDYEFLLNMHPVPLKKLSAVDYTFASLTGTIKGAVKLSGSLRKPVAQGCMALLDTKLGEGRASTGSIELSLDSREQTTIGSMKLCTHASNNTQREYINICTLEQEQIPSCPKGEVQASVDIAARANTDIISLSEGADPLVPTEARKARGPLKQDDDLYVSIHTRNNQPLQLDEILPMNIIKSVATNIEGSLKMDVDIQGTYDTPVPTGEIALKDAGLTLPGLGRRFEEINMGVTMDDTTLNLNKLTVHEGNSNIAMRGELNHDKLKPTTVNAELSSEKFNVGAFVGIPFFATGDFKMDGDLSKDPMALTVDVSKLDIQLTEDIGSDLHPTELEGDIIVLTRNPDGSLMLEGDIDNATTEQSDESQDFMSSIALNTRVKMSRNCWVHHPYGEVNLTGDFTAMLDGPRLTMSGEIEALRGQAEFLGKIFRVERALITFTGADPPDPRLQIEAAYELDQNIVQSLGPASDGRPRIMVLINGSAYEPILKLSSDPTMSETDIIYVLATNRPPGTSGVGQDSSVAAAALSAASGLVVGMLKDELSDSLPLDFFDVLNVDTSNFEVGKYVYNGKIYLSYRYLFGNTDGNSSIYQFDYHFQPRWTLEAQGSNGDSGGELNLNVFWDAY